MSQLQEALKAILFWVFRYIYSKVLSLMCDGARRTIPTTKDSLLMESATSLAGRIRNQKVTSFEVVRSHVNRIQEINDVLNCVVDERFEEALEEARKVDELIRSGAKTAEELERETPFLGVPFTTPESVAIKGLSNTMGIWSRRGARADADAGVVRCLRAGGAIPLACTNVSERCLPRETHNPVFGRTSNPYDTNRSAGGPFGGEGCLIASSGSPLGVAAFAALPCAFNGVFGHRPSAACARDAAGPMSRSSADLLPAFDLLSKNSGARPQLDEPVQIEKLKYYFAGEDAVSSFASPTDEEIKQAVKKLTGHWRNFHKASVQRVDLKELTKGCSIRETATKAETVLGKDENKVNPRKELVKALLGRSRHTFIFLLSSLLEGTSRQTSNVKQTEERKAKLFAVFQELLGSDGVLICPTHPTAAFRHKESIAGVFDCAYGDVFEALGLPATYCPAGLDSEGLPVGVQVVAAMNQDRLTLAVARDVEKVLGGWKPPPTHGNFTLKNTVFHNLSNEKLKTL